MCYLKLGFKFEVFCSVLYIVRYVWKHNVFFFFFLIDSVRIIRPNCNYIYFVYYYIDICDSTLIDIFVSKT